MFCDYDLICYNQRVYLLFVVGMYMFDVKEKSGKVALYCLLMRVYMIC